MRIKGTFFIIIFLTIIPLLFSCNTKVNTCFITSEEAVNEIENIKKILKEQSPFIDIHPSNVLLSLDALSVKIRTRDNIDPYEFSVQLKEILVNLRDRHLSVNYKGTCQTENKYYLPFATAPWGDSVVIALSEAPKVRFSFLFKGYPYLTHINDQKVIDFIHQNDPENKHAANFSSLAIGVAKLNEFYKINSGLKVGDKVKLTFSSQDFNSDTTIYLKLVKSKSKWREVDSYLFFDKKNDRINQKLYRQYQNQIDYIKIPEMYSYSQDKEYFKWLKQKMRSIEHSNALIIDLRNNPGGKRDLINFFSNYLIASGKFMVANLARYRGEVSNETKESLQARRLYPASAFKEAGARVAIHTFMKSFVPTIAINEKLYSEYFYMVLRGGNSEESYYYNKPVYILTNELTFSAASVFASSFHGLENIKIAGVLPDGSSGMAKVYELKYSRIQLKLSHMLSYQKNGQQFDGIGTHPDIEIKRSIEQVLGEEDYQLKILLKIIEKDLK